MKKAALFLIGLMAVSGVQAQTICVPNTPGSLLVFPLIDNSAGAQTIIEIVNRGPDEVYVQGVMVVSATPTDAQSFVKKDFIIHLTAKEPFFWNTSKPYNRMDADEVRTQIPAFAGEKGFCFVWAIDAKVTQMEIDWDFLTGDALVYGGGAGMSYNAYPHQALAIAPDRVLNLDGFEYCAAPSQIMIQGFAAGVVQGLSGTLVICALDIDFVKSVQPEFDINIGIYNQDETYHSRHLHCYQFGCFDLVTALQLHVSQIFTPKFQLEAVATQAARPTIGIPGGVPQPMWAVFMQSAGGMSWGDNVWQGSYIGKTSVYLPGSQPR